MNIVWLQIASLVYIILLNIVYFSKNRLDNIENRIYKRLLLANVVGLLIELSCFYTATKLDTMKVVGVICARSLLVYYMFFTMLYTFYVLVISNHRENIDKDKFDKKLKLYKTSCSIVFIISSIIITLLPMEIYYDGVSGYSYGQSIETFKLILVCIMFVWIFEIIKNIKNIRTRKYLPIILFIVLALLTGVVQNKYPELLLTTPVETFIVFLMFFTIENPDMRMIAELNRTKNQIEKNNSDNTKFLTNVTKDLKNNNYDMNELVNKVIDTTNEDSTKESMYQLRYLLSNMRIKLNDALDISSADAQNIKVTNNKYDLKQLIKEVELRLKNNVPEGVEYRSDIADSIPDMLYGESVKMKQILSTVLQNAFQYTKEGSVELRCNSIIKDDVCRLFITVEDTGTGMDLHQINEVLISDALDKEDLEKYDELNLNLKLVRKMIHVMGGTFTIDSEVDKGTKVIIALNQKIYEEENKELKDIENIEKQVFDKKIIVVVGQHLTIRKSIVKALIREDYNIIECETAKECLDMLRKDQKIDAIVCEENMDKIDARGLLEKIKSEERHVPIIMVTEDEEYNLKHIKLEGFASCVSSNEITSELLKKLKLLFETK